jgi:hypothetical protein
MDIIFINNFLDPNFSFKEELVKLRKKYLNLIKNDEYGFAYSDYTCKEQTLILENNIFLKLKKEGRENLINVIK